MDILSILIDVYNWLAVQLGLQSHIKLYLTGLFYWIIWAEDTINVTSLFGDLNSTNLHVVSVLAFLHESS